ncbi:MAG: hypothetical protein ACPGXK_15405 [Phycisphaerae bacterium]
MRNQSIFMTMSFACSLFGVLASTGCVSRLRVDVDVYTGPLINAVESRLGMAVGIARGIRDNAIDLAGSEYRNASRDCPPFLVIEHASEQSAPGTLLSANANYVAIEADPASPDPHQSLQTKIYMNEHAQRAQLFAGIAEYYDELAIDGAYAALLEAGGPFGDAASCKQLDNCSAQNLVIGKLLAYSQLCRALAVPVGTTEELKWFGDDKIRQASATIDEAGQILQLHVDSVIYAFRKQDGKSHDAEISAVMRSQAPSTVLALRRELRTFDRYYIDRVFGSKYWKNINTVNVEGSGEVEYMLVKDEIGNWHLKQATVDPTKILNAINTVSVAAVRIAAAAAGIPIPSGQQTAESVQASTDRELHQASNSSGQRQEKERVIVVLQNLLGDIIAAGADRNTVLSAIDEAIGKL